MDISEDVLKAILRLLGPGARNLRLVCRALRAQLDKHILIWLPDITDSLMRMDSNVPPLPWAVETFGAHSFDQAISNILLMDNIRKYIHMCKYFPGARLVDWPISMIPKRSDDAYAFVVARVLLGPELTCWNIKYIVQHWMTGVSDIINYIADKGIIVRTNEKIAISILKAVIAKSYACRICDIIQPSKEAILAAIDILDPWAYPSLTILQYYVKHYGLFPVEYIVEFNYNDMTLNSKYAIELIFLVDNPAKLPGLDPFYLSLLQMVNPQ